MKPNHLHALPSSDGYLSDDEAPETLRVVPAPRVSEVRLRACRPSGAALDIVVAPLHRDPRSEGYDGEAVRFRGPVIVAPPHMVLRRGRP